MTTGGETEKKEVACSIALGELIPGLPVVKGILTPPRIGALYSLAEQLKTYPERIPVPSDLQEEASGVFNIVSEVIRRYGFDPVLIELALINDKRVLVGRPDTFASYTAFYSRHADVHSTAYFRAMDYMLHGEGTPGAVLSCIELFLAENALVLLNCEELEPPPSVQRSESKLAKSPALYGYGVAAPHMAERDDRTRRRVRTLAQKFIEALPSDSVAHEEVRSSTFMVIPFVRSEYQPAIAASPGDELKPAGGLFMFLRKRADSSEPPNPRGLAVALLHLVFNSYLTKSTAETERKIVTADVAGVIGHEIGNIFKLSGILKWLENIDQLDNLSAKILGEMLRVWGISQALRYTGKRALLNDLVGHKEPTPREVTSALANTVRDMLELLELRGKKPVVRWVLKVDGSEVKLITKGSRVLPPFLDGKDLAWTSAFTMGLRELLLNAALHGNEENEVGADVRRALRWAGRPVEILIDSSAEVAIVELRQPYYSPSGEGEKWPTSRTLDRIRQFEEQTLGEYAQTGKFQSVPGDPGEELGGVVMCAVKWTYRWKALWAEATHHEGT